MIVTLDPIAIEDKSTLQHLMELYLYDFSEFDRADVNEYGLYGYPYIDHYWTEPGRLPFLVRVDGKIAGFVLVSRHAFLPGNEQSISEFFIMRKYRRQGVGQQAAHAIFDRLPGIWEGQEIETNQPAHAFWVKVISAYTRGHYQEMDMDNEQWKGPVQWFDNSGAVGL